MSKSEYYVDLNSFHLKKLKYRLKNFRLLPSQQILRENLDEWFARMEEHGIENLQQLKIGLKSKSEVESFADETGIPGDYLTLLRREVNSYQPKPITLKDFPGVNQEVVHRLQRMGIKNTLHLFPHVLTPSSREIFAEKNGIGQEALLELTKLTDVARLKYVGPKFARLLIESEYDTVEKIAHSDPNHLYQALIQTNAEQGIYKGKFGIEDMQSWINIVVQDVPQVIEY